MELWRLKFMSIFFAAAFMLVVAIRLNIDQMYLMAGILVSIPLVSFALGSVALKQVHVDRQGPETCFEGDTVRLQISLDGPTELMRNLLSARDVTPDWVEIRSIVPDLDHPGQLTEDLVALRRGHYRLAAVQVSASDPLGLFVFHRALPYASELLVFPAPLALPEALLGREARSGREVRTSITRRGESPEMHSTREYQPGDELRHIHWPSTARAGRLVVMEREEPTDRTTWIALDLRRGSERGEPPHTSVDVAARLAAAAAREVLAEGEAVALLLPGMEPELTPPGRGPDHYYAMLGSLARAEARADVSVGEALTEHAGSAHARLVLFTAAPDPLLIEGLHAWIDRGGSVTGILLADSTEPEADEVALQAGFAAAAEGMGAVIHRISLDTFQARPPRDAGSREGGGE